MSKRISITQSAKKVHRPPSEFVDELKTNLSNESVNPAASPDFREIPIEQLKPNRYQPRELSMDDPDLRELADSIREQGIIQPIVVRDAGSGDAGPPFEILAGERRWRAARIAQLVRVPVLVREADDRTAAVIALLENLQRRDLNPIEEANGLRRLSDEFELRQNEIANLLGRSRASISRVLGLLQLDMVVKDYLRTRDLSAGHGKVLLDLSSEDQQRLAHLTVRNGWSVRDLERQKALLKSRRAARRMEPEDPDIADLQTRLSQHLATSVEVKTLKRGGGKIIISFKNIEVCQSVLERMGFKEIDF